MQKKFSNQLNKITFKIKVYKLLKIHKFYNKKDKEILKIE